MIVHSQDRQSPKSCRKRYLMIILADGKIDDAIPTITDDAPEPSLKETAPVGDSPSRPHV